MGEPFKRVTLIDSQSMSAEILGLALARRGYRCRVVGADSDSTPTSLMREVVGSRPELVVGSLDTWSGPADRAEVYRSLSRGGHRVVAVIDVDTAYLRGEALSRACAVASKAASLQEFLAVVRKTMHGLPSVDRAERLRLVGLYRRDQGDRAAVSARLASLSRQERVVLGHLMAGHVVSEIAVLRVVSELTVRTQVKAVLYKLDVASQIKAVALAWDNKVAPSAETPFRQAVPRSE